MLTEFSIGNYQSFNEPQRVQIKPITLIFGPNSAGKSALLRSLLVARHAIHNKKLSKSDGAHERHPGSVRDIWRNGIASPVRFSFGTRSQETNAQASDVKLSVEWGEPDNSLWTTKLTIHENGRLVAEYEFDSPETLRLTSFGPQIESIVKSAIEKTKLKIGLTDSNEEYHVLDSLLHRAITERISIKAAQAFPGASKEDFRFQSGERKQHWIGLLRTKIESGHLGDKSLLAAIEVLESACDQCASLIHSLVSLNSAIVKHSLDNLTHHGPIRPICDEIRQDDSNQFGVRGWLKLAREPKLMAAVNEWLGSSAFTTKYKIDFSRLLNASQIQEALRLSSQDVCDQDLVRASCECFINRKQSQMLDDAINKAFETGAVRQREVSQATETKMLSDGERFCLRIEAARIRARNVKAHESPDFGRIMKTKKYKKLLSDFVRLKTALILDRFARKLPVSVEETDLFKLSVPAGYEKNADGTHYVPAEKTDASEDTDWVAQAVEHWRNLVETNDVDGLQTFLLGGCNHLLGEVKSRLDELMTDFRDFDLLQVQFIDQRSNRRVHPSNLGVGFSQIMPIVVSAFGDENQLIAIEQPELHVHPGLQTELADLFIQSAKERGNRFLIETHSEHLILRLLRRVRETTEGDLEHGSLTLRPEDLCVLYVEPTDEGSRVIELPVTPDGDFRVPWPGGFFAERVTELFGPSSKEEGK
jgi:hypothetical protein